MADKIKEEKSERAVPDSAERKEALDPTRSFIVQAPAGSGKTALLIQRFLSLLSRVSRPEEVLAITFTKKAASEMHERIFDSLLRAGSKAEGRDENEERTLEYARVALKRSEDLGWALLENPARLQVQTIDSFCASLSRRLPLMSKLGANLSVTESPAEVYAEAARRTVRLIDGTGADAEAVSQVLRYHDNSIADVELKIVAMLEKREQWLRHTRNITDTNELRLMLEGSVARLAEDKLSLLRSLFPSRLTTTVVELARYAASNIIAANFENPIAKLGELEDLPVADAKGLQLWKAFAELFITKGGEWRKPRGVNARVGFPADKTAEAKSRKESFVELLGLLSPNAELLKLFTDVRKLPEAAYTDEDWSTLRALLHLLPVAVERLKEVFIEERAVDFSEISMAAIEALGPDDNPTDLMLSLDNIYSHILVDEYQDTSWTQVTLLRALTRGFTPGDGRTLFIVGDPMQSIYLFRDAEVGLFLHAREHGLENVELVPLTLRCNFRSDGHIVEWVNRTLVNALPEVEDVQTGAVVYEESKPYHAAAPDAEVAVRLYADRMDIYERKEAEEIISILAGLDCEDSRASKAVLVRSRSHLLVLVAGLKRAGIDFKAEELDPLGERSSIQDLFALTRALFHPADRVAWLSVLRARWCGLTLAELHILCVGDSKSPVPVLIKDKTRLGALDAQARLRIDRFSKEMDSALRLCGRLSPRRLIEGLWVALGGPACYEDADSIADAELFFDMIESVTAGGGLTSMGALESRVAGLYATHSGKGENPVSLMTIHKAKGLEFDYVFLPGLGRRTRPTVRKLLYWMERGDDLILAPIEKKNAEGESLLYRYLSGVQKKKEELEAARLFYVAVTRARKRLYLFGNIKKFEGGEISVESVSLLRTINRALCPEMVVERSVEEDEGVAVDRVAARLKRLPGAWQPPVPVSPAGMSKECEEAAAGSEKLKYDWATVTASYVGTAVHWFFCKIAAEGLEAWGGNRLERERGRMEALLLTLGISKKEVGRVADKGLKLVANALDDEKGRWVLGAHDEARVEWALSGLVDNGGEKEESSGGRVEEIVIDRSFVDKDNVRWIVDYKTGRHEGSSVEEFLAAERLRHSMQLEKYESVLRGYGETRQIKKALYYPALRVFIEL